MNECGRSDTFTAFVRVASGSLSGTIVFTDSLSSKYIFEGVVASTAISGYSGTGTSVAKITLNSSIINGAPLYGVFIKYLIKARCGVGSTVTAAHTLKLNWSGGSYASFGLDFISGIRYPNVVLDPRNTVNNANGIVDSIYYRKWRISNTGTGSQLDTVWFRIINQFGTSLNTVKINGTISTATKMSGDTTWFKIIQKLRNQSVFPTDTIFIEESYKINKCMASGSSASIMVFWGCYSNTNCNYSIKNPATQVPLTVPNVQGFLENIKYGCYGSYDTITMMFINKGAGVAKKVKIRLDNCYPIPVYATYLFGTSIVYLDTAGFKVKTGKTSSYTKAKIDSVVKFSFSTSYWPISTPPGIVYVSTEKLNPGDTFFVQFKKFKAVYNNSLCTASEDFLNFYINFKNNCENVSYAVPLSTIVSEAHRYYGKTSMNGPASLNNGDSAKFEFTTQKGAYTNHKQLANSRLLIKIVLPSGLVWNGNKLGFKLTDFYTYSKSVDSIYYNTSTNELEVYYFNMGYVGLAGLKFAPYFTLNCPSSASSANIKIQLFNLLYNTGCGYQKLPFSCEDKYPIQLICPNPCPRGGVSPYFSEFRRITYGKPDNNNDGIPDASGLLDYTKIEWNKLAPRDTFKLTYKGAIIRGTQSPSANFSYGYANIWIPNYGGYIAPIAAAIKIKDSSSGSNFSVTNLPITFLDTSTRRTIKIDFSTNNTGFPSGYYFGHRDSFELEVKFVYNQNVTESAVVDDAITSGISVYVSHLSSPASDTAKYRCLDLNANFRIVQVYKGYNGGFVCRPIGCNQTSVYSDYFQSVGDCCSNYAGSIHFPYEYRLFSTLDTIKIFIPGDYTVDSTHIWYVFTTGAGKVGAKRFTIYPISSNAGWYAFLLTPLYTFAGGSQVASTTGSYWQMYNYVTASCSLPSGNIAIQYTADRWIGRESWAGISTRGVASNHNRGTYEFVQAPRITVNNSGAIFNQGLTKNITWDIQVQNNAAAAPASFTWISPYSKSGKILIDSICLLPSNAKVNAVNNIYRLGNYNGSTSNKYRIYAKFNTCSDDTLKIYSGWDCKKYPTSKTLAASINCISDSMACYLKLSDPVIETDFNTTPSNPVKICDTLLYVLKIANINSADAKLNFVDIIMPTGGLGAAAVPSYGYKYPSTASSFTKINPVNMGSGIYRFYLTDSIAGLKANGLRALLYSPNNEILLKLRIITNCDFLSGTQIRFIANYSSICGKLMPESGNFHQVNILGAPNPKLHLSADSMPVIKKCDSNFVAKITLKNFELTSSTKYDQLWVTLPNGVYYLTNSAKYLRNKFNDTIINFDTVAGRQRLKWTAYPIPSYDSAILQFKVRSPSNVNCGPNNDFFVQTISTYKAVCRVDTCFTNAQNQSKNFTIPPLKPAVVFTGMGTVRLVKDTTTGNTNSVDSLIFSNIQFKNTGNQTANKVILKGYYDANGNNLFDFGETLLMMDSLSPMLAGGTASYSRTCIYSKGSLPSTNKIKFWVDQECNCGGAFNAAPAATYIPLTISNLFLTATHSGGIAALHWMDQSNSIFTHFDIYIAGESGIFKLLNRSANQNVNMGDGNFIFNYLLPYQNGKIYFKVVGTSNNGTQVQSNIAQLQLTQTKQAYFIPNPAKTNVQLYLKNPISSKQAYLIIYNCVGKKVAVKSFIQTDKLPISVEDLTAGIYYFELHINGKKETHQLVVNH